MTTNPRFTALDRLLALLDAPGVADVYLTGGETVRLLMVDALVRAHERITHTSGDQQSLARFAPGAGDGS